MVRKHSHVPAKIVKDVNNFAHTFHANAFRALMTVSDDVELSVCRDRDSSLDRESSSARIMMPPPPCPPLPRHPVPKDEIDRVSVMLKNHAAIESNADVSVFKNPIIESDDDDDVSVLKKLSVGSDHNGRSNPDEEEEVANIQKLGKLKFVIPHIGRIRGI